MAIPPTNDILGDQIKVGQAILEIKPDVIGVQEVDEKLERSGKISQIKLLAQAMGTTHWAFAPSVIGTPGFKWRALEKTDLPIVTDSISHTNESEELAGAYGIGIASKIPVKHWDRIDLGRSIIGMPLIIPTEGKNGKQSVKPIYVSDEPRVALAATLENGWTVINTHLSFVPIVNVVQLRRIKLWAKQLSKKYGTQVLIIGDLNLPKGIPAVASSWNSLVTQNTYPSWGAKIQFDYILSNTLKADQFEALETVSTGISDHLPIRIRIK
jgi:endonuclease/exonuclease/phosphatase family metal-dependent hydrolase